MENNNLFAKNIKKPVTKKVAKVPVVLQLEALECGAACLTMILAYYDKWLPLEQVRYDCGVSRNGSNAKNILKAARSYGLISKGYSYDADMLRKEGKFPCIIHWDFNHFVVLNGFKNDKAVINDPGMGTYKVDMETFEESFTGICLVFEPGENFEPSGKKKSVFEFAKDQLKGTSSAVAFVILTSVIISLLGIVNPAFSRIFLDRILTGENPSWITPFIIALSVFDLVWVVTAMIKEVYIRKINGKMDVVSTSSYMWKILRMPMKFYSQRMAGDLQQRQKENSVIASDIINTLAPLVLDAGMLIFYFVVMLRFSVPLALIGFLSVGINLVISRIIAKRRLEISRVEMKNYGKLIGTTVSGIEMIETIKSTGAENGFFQKWAGYQANVNNQEIKNQKINNYLGILPQTISMLTDAVIIIVGVYLVIQGNFTVGMIMAFQGLMTAFIDPCNKFIDAGDKLTQMRITMERVEDVMKYPEDSGYLKENLNEDKDGAYKKLKGNIELKNVTFGYSRLDEPLINDFNLTIKSGQKIAIVGSSGCGKSTISKLVSGLYHPWSGEILFDGKAINEIPREVFTGSLAVVDQDIIMFEDTIAANIKMWDDSIEDFEMILAARDASLHEEIMKKDGGYNRRITEGGKDFSGGQRQRIEIARVLAQDPTIIIMDEATSALDAKTELDVVNAIKDRGITCIVVAHRLSTIRDCDVIYVLDNGAIIESGTHEELMSHGGKYAELIASE